MAAKRASEKAKSRDVFGQSRKLPKMFRAGIYARVSTNDQQTLPMQSRAMREYAARRGWTITAQVREVGSGAAKREAREKLLEAARRREIDVVVVWRLDRWGRSLTDLLATLQGTGTSRRGLRVPDGGAGADHAGRACNGRTSGYLRGVRKGDSAGTNAGWLGPRPAERQTAGAACNRRDPHCGNPETTTRRRQPIRDRPTAAGRPDLGAGNSGGLFLPEIGLPSFIRTLAASSRFTGAPLAAISLQQ